MIPVLTPEEMRAVDAAAPEPLEELISRAGAAVARVAVRMLGGTYGRVVNVIVGRGTNGADGREAARRLVARGVKVSVWEAASCPAVLPPSDLVIDAAYGTGFRSGAERSWRAPDAGGALVLAVDIPSGVDALTGDASGSIVLRADRTVTFQALKPGVMFGDGPSLAGVVDVVDIGLDVSQASVHAVEKSDVAVWWPRREVDAHKWKSAVKVIAGSRRMPGAAQLCAAAAARGGSGLVSLSTPGGCPDARPEVVRQEIPATDFAAAALCDIARFSSMVIGPGLGREERVAESVRQCVAEAGLPIVIDGDAIAAVASHASGAEGLVRQRDCPTVFTPHDSEFAVLTGASPGADRVAAVRSAADLLGAVVLLKGSTTVVTAASSPDVWLISNGDERLATAGTGDVLAGLIAAALAAGVEPARAAAASAWLHASAANLGPRAGLLAGDIVELLPAAIAGLS
jgi:ADP-dependent NAD(P)H-hydrate dehydratase / NAD(P)H-hydrate epimerase